MVHELILNPEAIAKKLKFAKFDFVYGWTAVNKSGQKIGKIVDLRKPYKKINDNFKQFFTSVILIIGILHNKLKLLRKENVN